MEITLASNQIDCYEQIGKGTLVSEETAECVVSDLLPDIAGILDADGWIAIQTKSADPGKVSVTATVSITVLYQPDDSSGIRRIPVSIPCSIGFELPEMTEQAIPVVRLELESVDARILNPRKILVRAGIRAEMECYRAGVISLPCAVQQSPENSIRTLDARCGFTRIAGVHEKTVVLTEESQIPAALPPIGELFKSRVDAVVEDVKPVGNKLILKGSFRTSVLYAGLDGGELCAHEMTTAFSQIVEAAAVLGDPMAEISLVPAAIYVELMDNAGDRRKLGVEAHFVVQVVCRETAEIAYLADAYDPYRDLMLQTETKRISSCLRPAVLRESVRELIELQHGVEEVLHVYALPGAATVKDGTIQCPIRVQMLYRSETSTVCRAEARYTVESSQEVENGAALVIREVRCGEAYAVPAAGGIEVRVPVELLGAIMQEQEITAVTGIAPAETTEGEAREKPSLYLLQTDPTDTIWALAKRYGSTPELIRAANEMEAEEEAGQRLLLIPRAGM